VDSRPGFIALLEYYAAHAVSIVLAENASRFARDLIVQLTGHTLLREHDIELIPVDAPTHFTDPTPTAEIVQQILGAVSQFEKASLVAKLRHAREQAKATTGPVRGAQAGAGRGGGRSPPAGAEETEDRPAAVAARSRWASWLSLVTAGRPGSPTSRPPRRPRQPASARSPQSSNLKPALRVTW
jgi:DNA invertase Pin-like site-specific DNA recombinase